MTGYTENIAEWDAAAEAAYARGYAQGQRDERERLAALAADVAVAWGTVDQWLLGPECDL